MEVVVQQFRTRETFLLGRQADGQGGSKEAGGGQPIPLLCLLLFRVVRVFSLGMAKSSLGGSEGNKL